MCVSRSCYGATNQQVCSGCAYFVTAIDFRNKTRL